MNPAALASALSKVVPLAGPLQVTLISGGKSNLTYRVTDGTSRWIARRPPLGDILPGAHDVGREYRVMGALHDSHVPVPAMRLLCEDPAVVGAPFYLMDEITGRVLRKLDDVAALTVAERRRLGGAMTDTIAALHNIDADAVGLGDLGRPDGYLQRQLDRWVRQYRQTKVRDLPELEAIAAALDERMPETRSAAIVHGDFRLDNVIVSPGDPGTIAAVLDWEMATRGDALADLATFLMFWDEPGLPPNPISGGLTAMPGFPSRSEVIHRYAKHRQLAIDQGDMDWYLVFAQFRLAVILEQIHARHLAGRTRGGGFEGVGDMATWLLLCCSNTLFSAPPKG